MIEWAIKGRHYVARLSPDFQGPRYNQLRNLHCEIQLRTILQDAWAQLSHNLVYKSESSIPPNVARQLNNVSSLLEVAQSVFDSVKQIQSAYLSEIEHKKSDPHEFLAQLIDSDTLAAYTEWRYPELPLNRKVHELLIRDLDRSRFRTLADIDLAVDAASDAVECYRKENPAWFKSGTAFITKSLGFVDESFRKRHPFAARTREAFRTYAHMVQQKRDTG